MKELLEKLRLNIFAYMKQCDSLIHAHSANSQGVLEDGSVNLHLFKSSH